MHRWSVSKAAVVGARHSKVGEPCGDAVSVFTDEQRVIAILSDGAGSAPKGYLGAEIVTRQLCEQLSGWDRSVIGSGGHYEVIARLQTEIESVHESIALSGELSDFDATLVGVVAVPERAIIFHIGDGAAAVRSNDGVWTVSEPANGDYANETYFFTLPDWREHLRVSLVPAPRAILLASDGAGDIAFDSASSISEGFAGSLSQALSGLSAIERDERIAALLNWPDVQARNDDDKSLIWVEFQ